jgi:hypothetical protein
MNAARRNVLRRAGLIAALSAAIIAVAVVQGRAIIRRGRDAAYHVRSGKPPVEPVSESLFVRSYPMIFNGLKAEFAHYSSRLPADEVIKEYRQGGTGEAERRLAAPMLSSTGTGCSVLSYGTKDGTVIGIVAFDNADSGGSDYFVGSMPMTEHRETSGDCPGREPPGVPKPPRSTRTLCIENLGGLSSVLAVYDAWGRPSELAEDIRRGMAESRWKERTESSTTLTENYAGHALLSFSRGREQCVVAVDQEPKTGKIGIVVFWAERPWLPAGTAL